MPTYKAPVDDYIFLMNKVLKIDTDLAEPILQEAAKLCEEVIAPTNQAGDSGCHHHYHAATETQAEINTVHVPEEFHEPWKKFKEGGWLGLSVPEQYGGQGLPYTLASAVNEFVSSANMAFSLCPGLTRGAIQALLSVASDPHKQHFIPPMARGEWTGTMNLTEPHCGTDLGLLKTKAVDKHNGSYEITGQKIFISCGEHDLADNIIHLVLARVEGDPEGVKGISMFAVPKVLADFSRNKVSCGSIEHKMGIHGSPTCVMNYDGATGYLIGERCKGLNAMFIMMNEARLGVAVQGLSQSELAYQNAVTYAKERIQGPKLTNPAGGSVAIINHPDVRRMLLDIKSNLIPSRLLVIKAGVLCDDPSEEAQDILGLMTPILKGVLTDYGFENAVKAQQVFGGHGYIHEWGMEQIVRDARIAQIYEGANGIQALDLVARKLPKNMGRAVRTQFKLFEEQLERDLKTENVNKWAYSVDRAFNDLKKATNWLVQNGLKDPNNAGSASYDYMKLFGLVYMGFAWLDIIKAKKEENEYEDMPVADYFMNKVLPETNLLWHKIEAGSKCVMELPVDKF